MADEDELTVGGGAPIRPPRLEDAGLEDCALPPESIAEAFSLAAAAVSSRLARLRFSEDSDNDEEGRISASRGGGCVDDAGPDRGAAGPDALVGGDGVAGDGGADEVVVVGAGRGGGYEDAVVVGGRGEEEDAVVVLGERRGEKRLGKEDGCVEGVREGVNEPRRKQGDEEGEEAAEKAILVPDFD